MKVLGNQLDSAAYTAFRQALAERLPGVAVQTVNAAGKFAVNGRLTTEQVAAVHALYDEFRTEVSTGFNMLIHQAAERRRNQTHNARQKRSAMTMRFHGGR